MACFYRAQRCGPPGASLRVLQFGEFAWVGFVYTKAFVIYREWASVARAYLAFAP